MRYSACFALFFAVITALPAHAQDRDVQRRMFTFLDRRVTVEVLADMPGTLRVIRGEPGRIDVTARVPGGIGQAALGGRSADNLRLTAVGGDQADFIVVVPEDVYLRVRLPGDRIDDLGSTRPGGTFNWPATSSLPGGWGNGANRSASNGAYTNGATTNGTYTNGAGRGGIVLGAAPAGASIAHAAEQAPRLLDVSKLNAVRTVTVRIEPGLFEVAGMHPMTIATGNPGIMDVRPGDVSEDVKIAVPGGTRDFTLKLGGRTALVLRGNEVTAYCEPVTEQQLSGGRRWFTFSPEAGLLTCR